MIKIKITTLLIVLYFSFFQIFAQSEEEYISLFSIINQIQEKYDCNFSYVDNDIKGIELLKPPERYNLQEAIKYLEQSTLLTTLS